MTSLMNPTKEKILAAASQLFLNGGVAALSVRAISREAEMSTMGIYKYFNGKQGILDALYIEGFEKVFAATDVPFDRKNPKDGLLRAATGYMRNAEAYQGHYRLIFGESDAGYQPSEEAKKAGERAFIHLTKIIAALLPEGASFEQRQKAALQIWALVHGYVELQNHAIGDVIEPSSWEVHALDAVSMHIDALEKSFNK